MNATNENVDPNAVLLIEVDHPVRNIGSTNSIGWLNRLEEWVNFLNDALKILTE